MEKRKYTKLQVLEPEIVSMQEAGKTHREINSGTFRAGAQSGQKMSEKTPYQAAKAGGGDRAEAKGRPRKDGQPPRSGKSET